MAGLTACSCQMHAVCLNKGSLKCRLSVQGKYFGEEIGFYFRFLGYVCA